MGSVINRGTRAKPAWVVSFKTAAGKWRQLRVKSATTKEDARAWLLDLESQAQRQKLGLEALQTARSTATVKDLLAWWWEKRGKFRRDLAAECLVRRHLLPDLGKLPISDVNEGVVNEYMASKSHTKLKPATVKHMRSLLGVAFQTAIDFKWKDAPKDNPVRKARRITVPRTQAGDVLKADEVQRVLAKIPARWRNLFSVAVFMGLRRGELFALKKASVNLEDKTLLVAASLDNDTTKGKHHDVLPIPGVVLPYLRDAIAQSQSALVFPAADGGMHSRHIQLGRCLRIAMIAAGVVESWTHTCKGPGCRRVEVSAEGTRRSCPDCGVKMRAVASPKHVRFHDLRHTCATIHLKAGTPAAVVQRLLRHQSVTTTVGTYGHLNMDDMASAVDKVFPVPAFAPVVQPQPAQSEQSRITPDPPCLRAFGRSAAGAARIPRRRRHP
jgi:integrase